VGAPTLAPATTPAIGTLAEEVLPSDDVELPGATLVMGAAGTVEAPMAVVPVVAVIRLPVPGLLV
jgi:hypothetical protein